MRLQGFCRLSGRTDCTYDRTPKKLRAGADAASELKKEIINMKTTTTRLTKPVTASLLAGLLCWFWPSDLSAQFIVGGGSFGGAAGAGANLAGATTLAGGAVLAGTTSIGGGCNPAAGSVLAAGS